MIDTRMKTEIEYLAELIQQADAIVVGAGSGLSSAAGYNHYHWMPAIESYLQEFKEYYQFTSPFAGFYYCYSSLEQQWAYYAKYIYSMWHLPTGQPYLDLQAILADKDCFVLTTNVDGQCRRVFPQERLCEYQGNMGYFQCSQPCHEHIYENRDAVEAMNRALQGMVLPTHLLPRCPECGRIMVPWVRDDTFLEGTAWQEGVARYHAFLRHWLMEQTGKKLLLLELGVGEMTPSIIKLPFWQLTAQNENVFYACLNQKDSHAPEHLKGKSLYLQGDLAETLSRLRQKLCKTGSVSR